MSPVTQRGPIETCLLVASPLALGTLEIFHPHVHDVFDLPLDRWLAVHYSQMLLFPLAALSVVLLVRGRRGFAAGLARVAMFLFGASYVAFDTAAGVVTGELVKAAQATGAPELWRPQVMAIWTHPIIGGAPGTTPLLAVAGSVAWSVGLVMAAFIEFRARRSWVAILLLIVSAFGLGVFRTHAWPGGPVSFGALGLAAAWIRWGERRAEPAT